MRVISLVIEGLEQAAETGCLEWLFAQDADIICLQDTNQPHMFKIQPFTDHLRTDENINFFLLKLIYD